MRTPLHRTSFRDHHMERRDIAMPSAASNLMTDPSKMQEMAGRFAAHSETVRDLARKMWASTLDIAGAGWSGSAQAASSDTMGQMHQAFNNITTMLDDVSQRLNANADHYLQQEQDSKRILSS